MPERIRLSRAKGWRKPEGAIVVARPSKWGNPFKVSGFMGSWSAVHNDWHYAVYETEQEARQKVVDLYRDLHLAATFGLSTVRTQLAGHDLACWCPLDQPCHADVLLEVANA